MSPSDKIAVIGHNGWAARTILRSLVGSRFERPIRVLARNTSSITSLPADVELIRYSWDDEASLTEALQGVDILLSFIGHDGLDDQKKLITPMKKAGVKLFAPSDLALPYTAMERTHVQVPRQKEELETELCQAGIPFVTVCIGNFTSFALGSPYMGIDLPNHRILHTGQSKTHTISMCSLDYVAAGYSSLFLENTPSQLAGRTIGLVELRATTADIEEAMRQKTGRSPKFAHDTTQNAERQALAGRLDALVRKKMGDGSHNVGDDIWEVKGYSKKTLDQFISGEALETPSYLEPDEQTSHFLDQYFAKS